jgi:aryl-alcohol dehydrogenase-like predicted oxidoreductase
MRYRPFARTGMAVSALSLALDGADDDRSANDWRDLMHTAFEEGVNAFEIVRPSPVLLAGFAEGAAAVKRNLIFVALRVSPVIAAHEAQAWTDEVLGKAGLETVNLLSYDLGDTPQAEPMMPAMLSALHHMKDVGQAERLAVAGAAAAIEASMTSGVFDAVITPFNLLSGWRERHLIRMALESQLGVIGTDPCPVALAERVDDAVDAAKPGWFKRAPALAGVGTYAFLKKTPGWTLEQLCVGYALTEPAVASVQVRPASRKHLAALAEAAERDMPAAVSAQIEMARFSDEREAGAQGRKERRSA